LTYPDGLVVTYTYDVLSRPTGVSFGGNSLSLAYDAAGTLSAETRSNGVNSTYTHDDAGRLTSVAHKKGGTVIADIAYTRDAAGQITEESGTWPLNAAPTDTASAAATYDNANGVVNWSGDSHTYDADGNLVGIAGSRAFSAAYDPENRPTSITQGASRPSTFTTLWAFGSSANRNEHAPIPPRSAGRLIVDKDVTGATATNYIYAGGRLVASGSAAHGYVFYHFDKTGNTLALTNSAGAVVGAFAYDPYGKVVARSGPATTPSRTLVRLESSKNRATCSS